LPNVQLESVAIDAGVVSLAGAGVVALAGIPVPESERGVRVAARAINVAPIVVKVHFFLGFIYLISRFFPKWSADPRRQCRRRPTSSALFAAVHLKQCL
jgi:hypothetical protein